MATKGKHLATVTDHINESVAMFGHIVAERIEVALIKVGRASPSTLKKWKKAGGTNDLLLLAEQIRVNITKQRLMEDVEQSAEENDLANEPDEGTEDGTVEEDKGDDDV